MELSLLARCKGETRDERRVLLSDCVTEATGVRSQWCSPKSSSARAEHSWGQAESLLLCSEGCRSAMGSAGDTVMWFRGELDNCDLKGSSSLTATPLAPKLFVCVHGRNVTSVITQVNMLHETELFLQGSIQLAWNVWSDYASIYKSSVNQWSCRWRRQYVLSHPPLHSGLLLALCSVI